MLHCIVTTYRYIGDECGLMSVVQYDPEEAKLLQLPYSISANSLNGNDFFFSMGEACVDYYFGSGLLQFILNVTVLCLAEAAGFLCPDHQPIVGVLPQPSSSGNRQDMSAHYINLISTFQRMLFLFLTY